MKEILIIGEFAQIAELCKPIILSYMFTAKIQTYKTKIRNSTNTKPKILNIKAIIQKHNAGLSPSRKIMMQLIPMKTK